MQTSLKDSFDFKNLIENLDNLYPIAKLFIYDAKSMYIKISSEYALDVINKYLTDNQYNSDHYNAPALIRAFVNSNKEQHTQMWVPIQKVISRGGNLKISCTSVGDNIRTAL